MPAGIVWARDVDGRDAYYRKLASTLTATCLGLFLAALLLSPTADVIVWIPALALCLNAILSILKGVGGKIGIVGDRVIAVDHEGRYFFGERKHASFGKRFVLAPDVVVPLTLPLLPNIDASRFQKLLNAESRLGLAPPEPGALELLGALWHLRHPWIRGLATALFGLSLSLALYLLTAP